MKRVGKPPFSSIGMKPIDSVTKKEPLQIGAVDHHPAFLKTIGEWGSNTKREPRRAQLDTKLWQPAALKETFLKDIMNGFRLLRELPPAVTFFGGARIQKEDPYYELAMQLGQRLAASGIPPRTGGGPGIMSAVPEGFKLGKTAVDLPPAAHFQPLLDGFSQYAQENDQRTQAFNIILPNEQKLNKAIDVSEALACFPYRKLALYENARGLVTFPGGFGTLDELFEIWALSERKKHNNPMICVGKNFWAPIFNAVEQSAVKRGLMDEKSFRSMKVGDEPEEIMTHLADAEDVRGFEDDPDAIAERMATEIVDAINVLNELPPAVTFIGGRRLNLEDPTCAVAEQAAAALTEQGVPLRVGGDMAAAQAVGKGMCSVDPEAELQGFLLNEMPQRQEVPGLKVHLSVDEMITHQELIGERSRALVALPGGIGTLNEVFTVLTQVQCKKREKIPIVLVGKDYWQPIFDAIKEQMLSGDRKTIAPEDLDLVTITDNPEVVKATLAQA